MLKAANRALMPLKVNGLEFVANGVTLIHRLNLTVEAGGLTVIMGANGAGKSVLLRQLHGLLPSAVGAITWGGEVVSPLISKRQAMVFQRPVLLRRSVAANLDFVLRLRPGYSTAWRRRRADELLTLVSLQERGEQPARLLSGGEQQRLALARALATEPDVLFLDEPTASLDPASVHIIERIVRQAHEQGTTVFFVTHDIGQAKRLADDILFLHHGRLEEFTPAERFFNHPDSGPAQAYLAGRIVF